jgi:hypothetical protein
VSPRWASEGNPYAPVGLGDGPPPRFVDHKPFPDAADDDTCGDCFHCGGHGWFTETVEGSDGRDAEIEWECGGCGGTGVES